MPTKSRRATPEDYSKLAEIYNFAQSQGWLVSYPTELNRQISESDLADFEQYLGYQIWTVFDAPAAVPQPIVAIIIVQPIIENEYIDEQGNQQQARKRLLAHAFIFEENAPNLSINFMALADIYAQEKPLQGYSELYGLLDNVPAEFTSIYQLWADAVGAEARTIGEYEEWYVE